MRLDRDDLILALQIISTLAALAAVGLAAMAL